MAGIKVMRREGEGVGGQRCAQQGGEGAGEDWQRMSGNLPLIMPRPLLGCAAARLLSGAQGVTGSPPPPRAGRKKTRGRAGNPCGPGFLGRGSEESVFFFFSK